MINKWGLPVAAPTRQRARQRGPAGARAPRTCLHGRRPQQGTSRSVQRPTPEPNALPRRAARQHVGRNTRVADAGARVAPTGGGWRTAAARLRHTGPSGPRRPAGRPTPRRGCRTADAAVATAAPSHPDPGLLPAEGFSVRIDAPTQRPLVTSAVRGVWVRPSVNHASGLAQMSLVEEAETLLSLGHL